MTYEPPPKDPRNPKKSEKNTPDGNPDSDVDKAKAYSREFEQKYNRWDDYPDREDPADYWKKK